MGKDTRVGQECSRPGRALLELHTGSWTFTKGPAQQVPSSGLDPSASGCYGLNVCIPKKNHTLKPNLQSDRLWRWVLWKVEPSGE